MQALGIGLAGADIYGRIFKPQNVLKNRLIMSRILKRPMFKRGGQANDGIMSNVVDREQYKFGSMTEE